MGMVNFKNLAVISLPNNTRATEYLPIYKSASLSTSLFPFFSLHIYLYILMPISFLSLYLHISIFLSFLSFFLYFFLFFWSVITSRPTPVVIVSIFLLVPHWGHHAYYPDGAMANQVMLKTSGGRYKTVVGVR
jgi:hypothetical protein